MGFGPARQDTPQKTSTGKKSSPAAREFSAELIETSSKTSNVPKQTSASLFEGAIGGRLTDENMLALDFELMLVITLKLSNNKDSYEH